MKIFYVMKEANTFSDTFECVGLASLLKKLCHQITDDDILDIHIEDKHGYFELTSDFDFTEENLENVDYFELLPFITNKDDKIEELNHFYYDYEKLKEQRTKFFKLKSEEQKDSELTPPPYYDILRQFANLKGYRDAFENIKSFEKEFRKTIFLILSFYYSQTYQREEIVKKLNNFHKDSKISIKAINALQDINPEKGKGVNQKKADSISPKGQNENWFRQTIRFMGAWKSFTAKYVSDKDFKIYSVVPKDIDFNNFSTIYESYKKLIHGNSSIKVDIILLNLLIQELIRNNEKNIDELDFFQVNKFISGMQFAFYKSLGQKPAVTNIGFLGIPDFIGFSNKEEAEKWLLILEEHLQRIDKIDEGNSSNIQMLQDYRDFFSAGDFDKFFDFVFNYSAFVISSINERKYYIEPFTKKNMEELMRTQISFCKILENKGFLAIAEAIRNSTIIPIIHNNQKDVMFGLSQKFNIASRTSETLMNLVSDFIQKYNEIVMLKDYHKQQHKKYVTIEEFEEFCKLLDEGYSSKTISGMLVAYGYSKEPKKENERNENGGHND